MQNGENDEKDRSGKNSPVRLPVEDGAGGVDVHDLAPDQCSVACEEAEDENGDDDDDDEEKNKEKKKR